MVQFFKASINSAATINKCIMCLAGKSRNDICNQHVSIANNLCINGMKYFAINVCGFDISRQRRYSNVSAIDDTQNTGKIM